MINVFNRIIPTRGLLFYVTEDLMIWISVLISSALLPSLTGTYGLFAEAVILALVFHLCLYYSNLYDFSSFPPNEPQRIRLLRAGGIGMVILGALFAFFPSWLPEAENLRLAAPLSLLLIFWWRNVFGFFLSKFTMEERILILGTHDVAVNIARELLKRKALGFKVVGFLDEDRKNLGKSLVNPKIIGTYENLHSVVVREKVDKVIIAAPERRGRLPIQELLGARAQGIEFLEGNRFYEQISGKIFLEEMKPSGFIYARGFKKSGFAKWSKRITGVMVSLAIGIITFPIMILLAILIKLDSPGPIFYRQERVGEEGKPFTLLKFRSMKKDAEAMTGPVWAEEHDPRVTRIGRIMRKTRLDELPQIINVLKGDMSFVGPRPERQHFVEKLSVEIPFYPLRFAVKPGVTGWAQISYPYGASVDDAREKLRYDLYYIKNMSLSFDLFIIFQTIKIVFFGRGAR